MKSIKIESEHFVLIAAFLSIGISWLHEMFFDAGIVLALLSYAIDLVKRVEEEDIL